MKTILLCFICMLVVITDAGVFNNLYKSWKGSGKRKGNEERPLAFLPKLSPHSDDCYLLEFHSDQTEYKDEMEPVLKRVEDDLDTKIRRINIFRRREFMGVLEQIGHDECGQLPFYYNRRTGQAVCGATSYMNLRRWAVGDLKAVFMDPPENLNRADEENFRNKRDIGAKGSLMESFKSLEHRGSKQRQQKEKQLQEGDKGGTKVKQSKATVKGSNAQENARETRSTSAAMRTAARKAEREAKKTARK